MNVHQTFLKNEPSKQSGIDVETDDHKILPRMEHILPSLSQEYEKDKVN